MFGFFLNFFILAIYFSTNLSKFHCATPSIPPTVTIFVQIKPSILLQSWVLSRKAPYICTTVAAPQRWPLEAGCQDEGHPHLPTLRQATRNAVKFVPNCNWKSTASSQETAAAMGSLVFWYLDLDILGILLPRWQPRPRCGRLPWWPVVWGERGTPQKSPKNMRKPLQKKLANPGNILWYLPINYMCYFRYGFVAFG